MNDCAVNAGAIGVAPPVRRLRLSARGLVQGVGFRPHTARLAQEMGLAGWVANSAEGATVEVEGAEECLQLFCRLLAERLPPSGRLDELKTEFLPPLGEQGFTIRDSIVGGAASTPIPPDIATCPACLREMLDPDNRRYRYPFINCADCGPRFSILLSLPYDRGNTTMRDFAMCDACGAEYRNPHDRRFHAQPLACPQCGPQLRLLTPCGELSATGEAALGAAAAALRAGGILALKGLGGFQLLTDARNEAAVARLRRRKRRPGKPFAVMAASAAQAARYCRLSTAERVLLTSPAAPIILLERLQNGESPAPSVAPDNPLLGLMTPYTPLHHLLMRALDFPVVATSGNISGEPMITEEAEALRRLVDVADIFLTHDRPIACAVDDSVVRIVAGRPLMLRRARGYAPFALSLPHSVPPLQALGGHLKAAPAVSVGDKVVVGPHVGDLSTIAARRAYRHVLNHLSDLQGVRPQITVCDKHPEYYTTRLAGQGDGRVVKVQHHLAHIAACMADNGLRDPVLGVAWDGTGYGEDGDIWGGEFIYLKDGVARRAASLRPFRLPGGDKAIREPRRAAAGLLYEMFGAQMFERGGAAAWSDFSSFERSALLRMLQGGVNAPRTCSVGRLFDAVAALLGLNRVADFEGQAAMALEFALGRSPCRTAYVIDIAPSEEDGEAAMLRLDWRPMVAALLAELQNGAPLSRMAAAFHNALAQAVVAVARHVGEKRVVLSGGCFQNRYLTEQTVQLLQAAGFSPFWHRDLPSNDGGLACGQAFRAAMATVAN